MELVPGRDCGTCNACCVWLAIPDPPELRKLGGEACRFCTPDEGCAIYETRPAMCRAWHCAWRALPQLGDEWRPDRSRIMVEFTSDYIPDGFVGPALRFMIYRDIKQLEWRPFVTYVAALVEKGVPLYLAVPVQMQFQAIQVFLNPLLKGPVARRNLTEILLGLSRAALMSTTGAGDIIDLAAGAPQS